MFEGSSSKLLVITPFLWTTAEDAGMPSAYRTLIGFRDNGFDVDVVLPDDAGPRTLDYRGLRLHLFSAPRFGLVGHFGLDRSPLLLTAPPGRASSLRWKGFLAALLAGATRRGIAVGRKRAPDVVYGILPTGALAAAAVGGVLRVPNVTRLFGTHLAPVSTRDLPRHAWEVAAFKAPAAKLIITDDGTMGDVVARRLHVSDRKVEFLMNGIDETYLQPVDFGDVHAVLGLPTAMPLFLSAHHLIPSHHLDALIEAVATLRDRGVRVAAVIAGDGPERASLEKLVTRRRVEDRVRLLGTVPRARMRELMAASRAVVSLDDLSNVVNSVLEALALGVPVVATRSGSTASLLREGQDALLLDPTSVTQLADRMEQLAVDADLHARLAAGARATAAARLQTWDARMAHEALLVSEVARP